MLSRDYFSNYLKQHEKTLFLQTALLKFIKNIIKGSKFNWCSSTLYFAELLQVSLKEDLVYNDYSLFAGNASVFIFHYSGHSKFIYHLFSEWAIHRFFVRSRH